MREDEPGTEGVIYRFNRKNIFSNSILKFLPGIFNFLHMMYWMSSDRYFQIRTGMDILSYWSSIENKCRRKRPEPLKTYFLNSMHGYILYYNRATSKRSMHRAMLGEQRIHYPQILITSGTTYVIQHYSHET